VDGDSPEAGAQDDDGGTRRDDADGKEGAADAASGDASMLTEIAVDKVMPFVRVSLP
jgi:hypothetical protein